MLGSPLHLIPFTIMYRQEQDIEPERGLNLSPAMLIDTLFAIGAIAYRIGIQLNELGEMRWGL
jgi:hypothetical protein